MKFSAFFAVLATLFVSSQALVARPSAGLRVARPMPVARAAPAMKETATPVQAELVKLLPAAAALTAAAPAYAEGMSGAMLPPIMVPLVGLVMPGIMMSLFFLLTQKTD
eukprot:CAMPEP_0205922180 /NCGR_PEP_ID=MMETSP1325-20131115/14069_1 /ASSEMBLY_ACC=CAM_ASM_000708 /TAXON_ID=236786 /ORGANISM="Florenciella sp., Strain RCC1007" /LENGTH=108 /DNA_ID=CAMNT_0053290155 /DNA_START=20 /DNA_END=346 /DNA_ORIENTATION=+